MQHLKCFFKVGSVLLLVLVLATVSGCDPDNSSSSTRSGTSSNTRLATGGSLAGTGATLLQVNHPITQVLGVILTVAGSYLMLDAAFDALFGGNTVAVELTQEQRAALQNGRTIEIVDQSGNKRTVGRNYAPRVIRVLEGSVAESLGIQVGDVLISYDGRSLAMPSTEPRVAEVVAKAANQGLVQLVVNRDGREVRYTVIGGARIGVEYRLE